MPAATHSCQKQGRTARAVLLFALTLLLQACGGGGGASTSSSPAAGSASSVASSTSSSSTASSSSSSTSASSVSSSRTSLYVTEPVVANCDAGQLKDSERIAVLDKLNAIRARHGMPAVTYDASDDSAAAQAALYMVANATATTTPSVSGFCYTPDAARLAAVSNVMIVVPFSPGASTQDFSSPQMIVNSLINANPGVLGRRRWVLDPFLTKTTFGRVDGISISNGNPFAASVLKVAGNNAADISQMTNDFVAYPYGIYPVSEFQTDWFLSFSAIASKTDAAANGAAQVSFASATVTVNDGSTALPVTGVAADYSGAGLPNSLQWKVTGLQTNVIYTVQINNVIVNSVTRQYTYTFTLQ